MNDSRFRLGRVPPVGLSSEFSPAGRSIRRGAGLTAGKSVTEVPRRLKPTPYNWETSIQQPTCVPSGNADRICLAGARSVRHGFSPSRRGRESVSTSGGAPPPMRRPRREQGWSSGPPSPPDCTQGETTQTGAEQSPGGRLGYHLTEGSGPDEEGGTRAPRVNEITGGGEKPLLLTKNG